jgi:hypothetical protein
MNLNDLANLGQIIGAIGVMITLVYLAIQIRGNLFGEEFRRHVEDDLMKRDPHPDAKPMGAFNIGRRAE